PGAGARVEGDGGGNLVEEDTLRVAEKPLEPRAVGEAEARRGEADEPATVPSVSAQGVARGGARWPPGQRSSAQAGRVDRLGSAFATPALLQGRTHAPPASGSFLPVPCRATPLAPLQLARPPSKSLRPVVFPARKLLSAQTAPPPSRHQSGPLCARHAPDKRLTLPAHRQNVGSCRGYHVRAPLTVSRGWLEA